MIINFVPNGLVLISNLVDPHVWLVHDALLIQTLGNPYYFVISGFQLIYPKNFSFVLEGGVVYPGFTLRGGSEGPCFSEVLCHKILYIYIRSQFATLSEHTVMKQILESLTLKFRQLSSAFF